MILQQDGRSHDPVIDIREMLVMRHFTFLPCDQSINAGDDGHRYPVEHMGQETRNQSEAKGGNSYGAGNEGKEEAGD